MVFLILFIKRIFFFCTNFSYQHNLGKKNCRLKFTLHPLNFRLLLNKLLEFLKKFVIYTDDYYNIVSTLIPLCSIALVVNPLRKDFFFSFRIVSFFSGFAFTEC